MKRFITIISHNCKDLNNTTQRHQNSFKDKMIRPPSVKDGNRQTSTNGTNIVPKTTLPNYYNKLVSQIQCSSVST